MNYPVVEHFYTIQGEGYFSGYAAYFIRLAGCDVGCSWCDTKESWSTEGHPEFSVEQLVAFVKSTPAELVVITGGEPAMHNLDPLITALQDADCHVNIETSGAHPMQGKPDWITLSPKRFKEPVDSIYALANEIKIIVVNNKDFSWGQKHADLCKDDILCYFQPEWGKPTMLPKILGQIKENPNWMLSLQTHKYLEIP